MTDARRAGSETVVSMADASDRLPVPVFVDRPIFPFGRTMVGRA
jgi:hypothetical protein